MKTPVILSFAAGAACGALGLWLLQPAQPAPSAETKTTAATAPATAGAQSKGFIRGAKTGEADPGGQKKDTEKSPLDVLATLNKMAVNDTELQDLLRKAGAKEVSREVDRLALRLNLTEEQKEKLRIFLMDQKERELARMNASLKGENPATTASQSKESFLSDLLSEEQAAEYAKAQQEEKTARAEDYAQRKLRRLDRDLNLTPQQEDALFQAFAQRRLTEAEVVSSDVTGIKAAGGALGHMSIAIAGGTDAGTVEPIEIDLPEPLELLGGSDDHDRALLEPVLTPEQLAAYDKQRAEATRLKWDGVLPELKTIREVSETIIE
jgi:hypothetical protein